MLLGRYTQQPGELLKRIIDLTSWLEAGEEIQTVVVKAITPVTDPPFECPTIVVDPAKKKFAHFTTGGVTDYTYTVEFRITTQTQVREDEIEFDVEEV